MKRVLLSDASEKLKIAVCGDIVQTNCNQQIFESGDVKRLFGEDLFSEILNADYRIVNLEAPLSERRTPIFKPGAPLLASTPKSVSLFCKLKPLGFSCANNHIKDYGIYGIKSTETLAKANDIDCVGVSSMSNHAHEPLVVYKNNISCAFYCVAENEFSIATENEGGANGYDPLVTFDQIQNIANEATYLIVLFHAGRENYRYPSVELQRRCRKMIECGAKLVVCQHSHCIGCSEQYKNGIIIYGQGNFCFNYSNLETWQTGLVLMLNMTKSDFSLEYIPINRNNNTIQKSNAETAKYILQEYRDRSEQIKDIRFIRDEWLKFCESQRMELIMQGVCGLNNRFYRILDKKLGHFISNRLYRNKSKRLLL